jgi:hypothetical protein
MKKILVFILLVTSSIAAAQTVKLPSRFHDEYRMKFEALNSAFGMLESEFPGERYRILDVKRQLTINNTNNGQKEEILEIEISIEIAKCEDHKIYYTVYATNCNMADICRVDTIMPICGLSFNESKDKL